MSTQLRFIAAAVTTAVAALSMGQASAQNYGYSGYRHHNGYGHTRTVRCESTNSRRAFCRVDSRGDVRIVRRLSRSACIQGRTWGSNDRGIWVSNGCRAYFAVSMGHDYRRGYGDRGYYDHNDRNGYNDHNDRNGYNDQNVNRDTRVVDSSGQVLQCDSTGTGRTYCHTESNRRYMLGRSRAGSCVEGQTWGTDDRGLWVSGDCRADFNYQH